MMITKASKLKEDEKILGCSKCGHKLYEHDLNGCEIEECDCSEKVDWDG